MYKIDNNENLLCGSGTAPQCSGVTERGGIEGGEWEEGSKGTGIYVFTWLTHDVVQQIIAQHCKVIIFQ